MRIREGDELVLADRKVDMALVAKMLDPVDARVSRAVCRARDAEVLGAGTDRLRAVRRAVWQQPGRDQVDRRLAEPRRHIEAARVFVDFTRRPDLDQAAGGENPD